MISKEELRRRRGQLSVNMIIRRRKWQWIDNALVALNAQKDFILVTIFPLPWVIRGSKMHFFQKRNVENVEKKVTEPKQKRIANSHYLASVLHYNGALKKQFKMKAILKLKVSYFLKFLIPF